MEKNQECEGGGQHRTCRCEALDELNWLLHLLAARRRPPPLEKGVSCLLGGMVFGAPSPRSCEIWSFSIPFSVSSALVLFLFCLDLICNFSVSISRIGRHGSPALAQREPSAGAAQQPGSRCCSCPQQFNSPKVRARLPFGLICHFQSHFPTNSLQFPLTISLA